MIPFVLIALGAGLLCGLRMSFVVFLPASVCALTLGGIAAGYRGASLSQILFATVLALVGLQAGYVGGLLVGAFLPVAKKRQADAKPSSSRSKR